MGMVSFYLIFDSPEDGDNARSTDASAILPLLKRLPVSTTHPFQMHLAIRYMMFLRSVWNSTLRNMQGWQKCTELIALVRTDDTATVPLLCGMSLTIVTISDSLSVMKVWTRIV